MNIIVFQVYQIENLIPNEIIKFLLKDKVNINLFNIEEQTALIIAAQKGYNDVVKLLLEKEADALIVDNYQKIHFLMLLKEDTQKLLKCLFHFHFKNLKYNSFLITI